jgi:hypothetical protein
VAGRKARRSDFFSLIGSGVVWPLAAHAQQSAMPRVGTANAQPRSAPQWGAFLRRMAELGYVESKNFT